MTMYRYRVDRDFPNGKVDVEQLHDEIVAAPTTGTLVGISAEGRGQKRVEIELEDANRADRAILDGVVAAHQADAPRRAMRAFRVADLPTRRAREGQSVWAIDGRKQGENAGSGTGIPVYFSEGEWRRYRDDKPVTA